MTSANGAKKFEERLKKIGVPYEIRVSIIGKEKVDFMTRARVAFNPSIVESYGMAFYEQITQLPTFCLEKQRWTKNFQGRFFFVTNKKEMAEDVKDAYHAYPTAKSWYDKSALQDTQNSEAGVLHKWMECFRDFEPKQSNSNTAKVLQNTTIEYKEYIKDLNRSVICIDDIRSVLTNKHKYVTIYTDENTYLSKDPNFEPSETNNELFIFE
jgi:hypothetical protein